jgi:hypothetical protein
MTDYADLMSAICENLRNLRMSVWRSPVRSIARKTLVFERP